MPTNTRRSSTAVIFQPIRFTAFFRKDHAQLVVPKCKSITYTFALPYYFLIPVDLRKTATCLDMYSQK